MGRVLVCGAYFADRENCIAAEVQEFAASRHHQVDQRWVALDFGETTTWKCPGTVAVVNQPTPKFTLMNGLLNDLETFDFVIIADDDVDLPGGFVDNFLEFVEKFQFALSQPARTTDSYVDHFITLRMPGLDARLTRFVEIGPIFCIHRSAFGALLPFDLTSPMGWGYDFVWPTVIERRGLRMGIVDATPVGHRIRKSVTNYSKPIALNQMSVLFATNPHLPQTEAFSVLESYA
jgi:hypothetical protein